MMRGVLSSEGGEPPFAIENGLRGLLPHHKVSSERLGLRY